MPLLLSLLNPPSAFRRRHIAQTAQVIAHECPISHRSPCFGLVNHQSSRQRNIATIRIYSRLRNYANADCSLGPRHCACARNTGISAHRPPLNAFVARKKYGREKGLVFTADLLLMDLESVTIGHVKLCICQFVSHEAGLSAMIRLSSASRNRHPSAPQVQ